MPDVNYLMKSDTLDVQVIFLKMLPNFKMAARGQLQNFLWAQNLQNLRKGIIQILLSHFPRYGDVQVIFLRFY